MGDRAEAGNLFARPASWACLAALAAALWLVLVVQIDYGGNWTALFCAGSRFPVPPALASENIYVFPDSSGYDGQFYLYIAHDPFFHRGIAAYVDSPRIRYRRILVPLAAYLLAGGNLRFIPYTYIAIVIGSLFAGAWWLARWTRWPAWGVAFLAVPAVFITLDRMVIDATLVALCAGFALYASRNPGWRLYLVLVLAALDRETGLLLAAAWCLYTLYRREWKRTAIYATSVLPCLAWYGFVQLHTVGDSISLFTWIPLGAWVQAFLSPRTYPRARIPEWILETLDRTGMLGGLLAMALAVRRWRMAPVHTACLLFALLAIFHGVPGTWRDPYGYTRSFGPLFFLLVLERQSVPLLLTEPPSLGQYGVAVLVRALR